MSDIYRNLLLDNYNKIHTTPMGINRIKRNINKYDIDVVEYCKKIILNSNCNIYKRGKNIYCEDNDIVITINSYSFTIITVHKV